MANKKSEVLKAWFTQTLMAWHVNQNHRYMPWKGERDPYKIWLSEIILQQTRVNQGMEYYEKFVNTFKTVEALAKATDEEVFKMWEGLGYYTRCRNLLKTARFVTENLAGRFPSNYQDLLKLNGVGPYTAAAIASFAFDLPYAVLDGNVIRVLARVFGISENPGLPAAKKIFSQWAQSLIDNQNPGSYNQAIMDFGATVCKPMSPNCNSCPLQSGCYANKKGLVNVLPLKTDKPGRKNRYFAYFIFLKDDRVWIEERKQQDIWQNLFQFWLIECESKLALQTIQAPENLSSFHISSALVTPIGGIAQQALTHQNIFTRFFIIRLSVIPNLGNQGIWVKVQHIHKYAFPKSITQFLENKFLPQSPT